MITVRIMSEFLRGPVWIYEDGIVSLEFLKSLVARKDICMPGTNESAPVSEEDKKEEEFDAV